VKEPEKLGIANSAFRSAHAETPEPALGLPLDRAASLLPADLLQGDELIILLLKPSLWYILLSSLNWLGLIALLAAAAIWAMPYFPEHYGTRDVYSVTLLAATAKLTWQSFEWLSRLYVLTDRRMIRVKGVLRVHVFQAELRNIQHTEVLFQLRERLVGLGTIAFATSGTAYTEAYWLMVARPMAIHRRILQAMNRYR
jgi:hypothetical protein